MPRIEQSALLPYSAQQMFDLVNDIESYPAFMQGCRQARLIERSEEEVTAELVLGKAGVQYAFTTRNTLQPPERMDMHLVAGPFRKFEAHWQFQPLDTQACKASLSIEFEFASGLANMAMSKVFETAGSTLVNAVCQRAEQLYGK